eukprot:UN09601
MKKTKSEERIIRKQPNINPQNNGNKHNANFINNKSNKAIK